MNLLVMFIFILCAALASGSILLTSRLLREHPETFLRSLLYHIIFIFAFGFYGIWGQFIIIALAGNKVTPEMLSAIAVVSLFMGLPFLVFAWLMLIKFGAEISGHTVRRWTVALFILVNLGVIIALGLRSSDMDFGQALPLLKYYYCAGLTAVALLTAYNMARGTSSRPGTSHRRILALVVLISSIAQISSLLFIPQSVWLVMLLVFLIFSTTSLLPVYLTYQADLGTSPSGFQAPATAGIEEFFRKYDISPREAEIIHEICNGLSNQEIAGRLFITLQTVKDHTSRIYSKTGVRNRMQLMTMVQGIRESDLRS